MTNMSELSDEQPFWLRRNTGFGQIRPEDDLLHPASFANVKDSTATETQYFGFSVPEANILSVINLMRWSARVKSLTATTGKAFGTATSTA